jgi:hypothetical protein
MAEPPCHDRATVSHLYCETIGLFIGTYAAYTRSIMGGHEMVEMARGIELVCVFLSFAVGFGLLFTYRVWG